jgi:sensor histidine kinase YesM
MFLLLLMLFYLILILLPSYANLQHTPPTGSFLFWTRLMFGFAIVPGVICFYSFYGFLFNRYLSNKKFAQFILLGLSIAIGAAWIGVAIESMPFMLGTRFVQWSSFSSGAVTLGIMSFSALVNGVIGAIIKGFISWFNDMKLKEELAEKNYEMELNLVKSQINPHFLFNTLNNIDVLIEKDPPKASVYFKKLSEIMRFMLYETKTEKIPVNRELSYIEKYIDLQKIRTANPDFVEYTIEGDPGNIMTEPMLFIPFIENAFKHAKYTKEGVGIRIHFWFTPRTIQFRCENNVQHNRIKDESYGGLGNGLIEKRLELLYPGKYALEVQNEHNHYSINLSIQHAG